MDASVVYMTAENKQQAIAIAEHLVRERLVACVNILKGATSIYWWSEHVEQTEETVLIAKTRTANVPAVIQRTKELHTYECPCITSWRIDETSPAYLSWIEHETKSCSAENSAD